MTSSRKAMPKEKNNTSNHRRAVIKVPKFILRRVPQVLIIMICATIILNCAEMPAVTTMAADTPTAQVDPSPTNLPTSSPSPTLIPTLKPPTLEPTPDNAAIWADYLSKTKNVYPMVYSNGNFAEVVAMMDSGKIIYETLPSPDPEILMKAFCVLEDGGQTFFVPCYYESAALWNSPLYPGGAQIKEASYTMSTAAIKGQLSDIMAANNLTGRNQAYILVGPTPKMLTGTNFFEQLYAKSGWLESLTKFLETGDPTVLQKVTIGGKTGRLLTGFRISPNP